MQTPVSIAIYYILININCILNYFQRIVIKSKFILLYNLNFSYIWFSNEELENKEKIIRKIKELDDNFFEGGNNNSDYLVNFRSLANGIFQAEGHIGGYFYNYDNFNFRPIVTIRLTCNLETLKFFVLLNRQLNKGMRYSVEEIPSGKFFVKLLSTNWDFIINVFIPYFNKVYGDKHRGLKRLENIYILKHKLSRNKKKEEFEINKDEEILLKEKIIILAYNLVDNSQRKLSISELYSLCHIKPLLGLDSICIEENREEMDKYFLLGFILGDGNIYVRIREYKGFLWFIPMIRLSQKITDSNFELFINIKEMLARNSINANIFQVKHLFVLSISEIKEIEKLSKWLPDDSEFWFWKGKEYIILKKALLLMMLKAKYWQRSKEIVLNLVYKLSLNYEKPINYWQNIIKNHYDKNLDDKYYISLHQDKSWAVKLPIKIKPKVKFFFFKTYNSKEKALKEAKQYRDIKLNTWLKDNKLID